MGKGFETSGSSSTGSKQQINPLESSRSCLFCILLLTNLLTTIGVGIAYIGLNSSIDITFPGCCGLIEGNASGDEEWSSIPGSPTECTMGVITDRTALRIVETYDNITDAFLYYCGVQTTLTSNTTLCDVYDQGSIETCLDIGGYDMAELCTLQNIEKASESARYKMLGAWFIAGLVVSIFYFLYWLGLGHALYNFLFFGQNEHCCFCGDPCLFNFSWSFLVTAQIVWSIFSAIYFVNHGYGANERVYRAGIIKDDAVQSWMMSSCSQNNYPIVLDISGFFDIENGFFDFGAVCAITNASVVFLSYLWLCFGQMCSDYD